MAKELAAGDRVTVYRRPLAGEDPEGVAVLVKRIGVPDGGGAERWYVRFDGEPGKWPRVVKAADRVSAASR